MCTGAILLYKIPRVVIGENTNSKDNENLLLTRDVEVVADDEACKTLMKSLIEGNKHVSPPIFMRKVLY